MGRTLPHNKEAEESVLGGILLNPRGALNQVLEIIRPDDFYVPAHQHIFEAALQLDNEGQPIDIITLEEKLKRNDKMSQIPGGTILLADLSTKVPSTENLAYHAKIIKDKSILRGIIKVTHEIGAKSFEDQANVGEFLDEAEQSIFKLSQSSTGGSYVPAKDILMDTFTAIESRYDKKESITGVPTGFEGFDKMTSGLQPADMIILAARPSMGKTALCLNIAQNAAITYKVPILIFSLEMSKESLIERVLCGEARVDSSKLRGGFLDQSDWMNLTRAASRIAEAPIWIDDQASPTMLELRAKARRFRSDKSIFKEPNQMGLIIVDYLQLIKSHRHMDNREREVAEISRSLKALAKETRMPVLALSQLRRAVEDRKDGRPMLSDLRESGAIEQDADIIMFIHRNSEQRELGHAELIIGKHRNGAIGDVPLVFLERFTRFEMRANVQEFE